MIIKQDEGTPTSYPTISGLSTAAQALNQDALWKRIEDWIAYRYGERQVIWTVIGPGNFIPPLTPYTIDTSEKWDGEQYESVTLDDAPLGYDLDDYTYRITATVGTTDDPPEAVVEAFTRLAEYLADDAQLYKTVNNQSVKFGSGLEYTADRPTLWQARALQYSGAADMLRDYRRP
ncbi:hypothetical protein [Wenzhouxiangella sp. EGI_FJ10305]|uniref:hypothetical protein n=1 Tax=Wenzhouxiangella sp. EGI_FJ10305 TaxID=3243768 RepID=UPI0035D58BF1